MVVGQHVTVFIDDHSRTQAVLALDRGALRLIAEKSFEQGVVEQRVSLCPGDLCRKHVDHGGRRALHCIGIGDRAAAAFQEDRLGRGLPADKIGPQK